MKNVGKNYNLCSRVRRGEEGAGGERRGRGEPYCRRDGKGELYFGYVLSVLRLISIANLTLLPLSARAGRRPLVRGQGIQPKRILKKTKFGVFCCCIATLAHFPPSPPFASLSRSSLVMIKELLLPSPRLFFCLFRQ